MACVLLRPGDSEVNIFSRLAGVLLRARAPGGQGVGGDRLRGLRVQAVGGGPQRRSEGHARHQREPGVRGDHQHRH